MAKLDLATLGVFLLVILVGFLLVSTPAFPYFVIVLLGVLAAVIVATWLSVRVAITQVNNEIEKIAQRFSGITTREP